MLLLGGTLSDHVMRRVCFLIITDECFAKTNIFPFNKKAKKNNLESATVKIFNDFPSSSRSFMNAT